MKNSVLIIGSGFAGMWSAVSAARLAYLNGRDDVEITVLAPRPELGIRPRFYEANVSTLAAPLGPLFSALGIRFIAGAAEHIDTHQQQVTYREPGGATATLGYQRLILATGSRLRREGVAGIARYGFDIDNQESAAQLERHLSGLADQPESVARNTVVVCGGGFTGIELACELPARLHQLLGGGTQIKVIVVDRGQTIASRYSAQMRETIVQASAELGVEWRLNSQVASVDAQGVTLADGSRIAAHTVVWTAGVQASDLSGQISAPRDARQRLVVNEELQVPGFPAIYATGDMAHARTDDKGHTALMTCQHAIQLGKFAGHNAMASLLGCPALAYRQENYVTCLDLGAWGAVYTEGWDSQVKAVAREGKKIKRTITHELIYPPAADREAAFALADPLAKFV
ncbi:hypothetical protein EBL_c01700 [Shimwellia blattae DSM 4481 = NBRC 105725]|uniref:FAD/NAD(P)-binding domain-containing protein n=1 Tax=Shimwellia blattae (strain ATCC 29907 / DSM 4481 / JCM 1650 / NBRC 105725 / CDC 9005-74) TaxID=630626 RepID=I2B451_SHIBC|nr:FAD-dependent oxidoreductase [Shimwellia blattae]AFJ45305.1 hypothetical protein EBL_c01700 [Shimwellia blattae DSM 4481 = NBRC 105725]GAB80582.1 NADH dehydrogenase [Shimwellia blattae DSM 4481 = NBRC 105725]VEC19629.1 NADH dehydrogenase-like protein SAV0941 [Shimwellia blattae]